MPSPKGVITPEDQDRIRAALRAQQVAHDELVDAVLTAVENHASVRALAELTGLSSNTISQWKRGEWG